LNAAFVADASIGLAWVHPTQSTALTAGLLRDVEAGAELHVPGLWPLEICNALLVMTRRRLVTHQQQKSAFLFLSKLTVALDSEAALLAWRAIPDLAAKYNLSAYDACYLELAIRKGLPLASRDEPLRTAARKCAVKVL